MADTARWRALDAAARAPLEADRAELIVLASQFTEWCQHVNQVRLDMNNSAAKQCLGDALLALDTAYVDGVSAARSVVDQAYDDLALGPDEHQHAAGLGSV